MFVNKISDLKATIISRLQIQIQIFYLLQYFNSLLQTKIAIHHKSKIKQHKIT